MPRALKPIVVDTFADEPSDVKVLPGLKHGAQVFDLDQPNEVACESCGAFSPSDAAKCPSCGARWNYQDQAARANVARRQELAVGEHVRVQEVAKSRAVDPNLLTSVVDAWAACVVEVESARTASAAEVEASKERFEKACAVLWANDNAETRQARDTAHADMVSAPILLKHSDDAVKQVLALKPLAEESDKLLTAGPSAEAFRAALAKRMVDARKQLDAAFAEVVAAYVAQRAHHAAMKAASNKRKELSEKLAAIKPTLNLSKKLPRGFGHIVPHTEVSIAAARAIIDALSASGVEQHTVDDLRARIRWD